MSNWHDDMDQDYGPDGDTQAECEINGRVVTYTEKAILFELDEDGKLVKVWIPRSQLLDETDDKFLRDAKANKDEVNLLIPQWLADKLGE